MAQLPPVEAEGEPFTAAIGRQQERRTVNFRLAVGAR